MDKKTKYQQPQAKGPGTDTKKNEDVTSSKLFPKSSRRREPTGAHNFSKNDQPRKSNAQKTKTFDKRPKFKGSYNGGPKKNSQVADDEPPECGSLVKQGSKKQNWNHLLNFHYDREVPNRWTPGKSSGYNSYNFNRTHKYNKEQFLQANCQFVVTANGDYSLYLNNPDVLVDWKLIQQIRIHSSDNLSCPICLYPPVAGKMTRCGHVFCWPCILHYLALSDKPSRLCPICFESVHKSDIKSVVEVTQNSVSVGDKITLRLMRREKGSLLAVPFVNVNSLPPTTFLSVAQNSCHQVYSKLLLAETEDILEIIKSEREQLIFQLLQEPDSPENCFIDQALNELLIREQTLLENIRQTQNIVSKSKANYEITESKNCDQENDISVRFKNKSEDEENQETNGLNNANDSLTNDLHTFVNDTEIPTNQQKFYYFYQVDGGQNVYLHALNVKMLEMQYGNLERCPPIIYGTLIEKEVDSFTEEHRRRMRYLCHLPITSEFEIVEIDLSNFVSDQVIAAFDECIIARQKKRKRREIEERKREKKITEEENKRMGKYPTADVHIDSRKDFPRFQPEADETTIPSSPEPSGSVASSPPSSSFDELVTTKKESNNWPVPVNRSHQRSFAQTVRANRSKNTNPWPSISKRSGPIAKPVMNESSNIDPELEEYTRPACSQNLGDEIARALEQKLSKTVPAVTKTGNKEKKIKPTMLLTTNMARRS